MDQYIVAWSCHGMCGTKLKKLSCLDPLSCRVALCHVVSCMCKLGLKVTKTIHAINKQVKTFNMKGKNGMIKKSEKNKTIT